MSSTKTTIHRALANLRITGIQVHELFVDGAVFRELAEDETVRKVHSPDRETELVLNTCNGPARVKRAARA